MKHITVKLHEDDEMVITRNLHRINLSLGRQLNLSDLIRFVLKSTTSKKSLFDLGYISLVELHRTPEIKKGKKIIKLKVGKLCK